MTLTPNLFVLFEGYAQQIPNCSTKSFLWQYFVVWLSVSCTYTIINQKNKQTNINLMNIVLNDEIHKNTNIIRIHTHMHHANLNQKWLKFTAQQLQ